MSVDKQKAVINFVYKYAHRPTNAEAQVDRYISQKAEQLKNVDANTTHPLLKDM